MRSTYFKSALIKSGLAASVLLLASGAAFAQQQVNLTAAPTTTTLPDGTSVPMWGYSCGAPVTGSTATCAALNPTAAGQWSPVVITVPTGADLQVNLTNNLVFMPAGNAIPTSLTIVGQLGGGLGTGATTTASPTHDPQGVTWATANTGAANTPPPQGPRVQSFSTEVAASPACTATLTTACNTTAALKWTAPKPGTYLIESGTHPSIQGPMGLYGILVVTAAPTAASATSWNAGTAYPNVSYGADVPLVLSEIDPFQNNAVDAAVKTVGFLESATHGPMVGGAIASFNLTAGGSGYTSAPSVVITGGGGAGASATATIDTTTGKVTGITLVTAGSGYAFPPNISLSGGGGTGAAASALLSLQSTQARLCGGAPACYPPVVNYTPLYYLINGSAFDKTNPATSLYRAQPGAATAPVSGNVLVRMVNAGLRMHVPAIVGSQTGTAVSGFKLIAEDGNPLPGIPRVQNEVFMAAGKTYDVMINAPAACTPASPATTCTTPALPVYDRELSLSGNSTNRDAGMLAYIGVNGAVLPAGAAPATATAYADTYNSVIPGKTLTVSDASKGVLANDINVYGVKVVGTAPAGLTLYPNGTFTYTAGVPTTFTYCGNGTTTGTACALVTLGAATIESAGGINCGLPASYVSNTAGYIAVSPPGLLAGCFDVAGYPLQVVTSSITTAGVVADANGGFTASGATSFTFNVQNSQGTLSANNPYTATIAYPIASNLVVTVLDGSTKDTTNPIKDYRWIIEEDRTFYVDPDCTTNPLPAGCPTATSQGAPAVFETNFHTSYVPVVATGCTGPLSCESGQSVLGQPAICDVGNGACRPDTSGAGHTPVLPSQVNLDPTKRYYISILPGDAAQPFISGYAGPTSCTTTTTPSAGPNAGNVYNNCGHGMGGAPIAAPCKIGTANCAGTFQPVTVLTQPSPFPPASLAVFVFEDDYPLNGEHNAGGGIDVLSPQEPGLGGFQITLDDSAGATGDPTGTPTYDMFNQPLSNGLAGTIDPATGKDACPIGNSRTGMIPNPNYVAGGTQPQMILDPNQTGITGMIVTCPKYESDGVTLSPLAGQARVNNLYPGRYGVIAMPGADRIARGEEWLQTNTLDGQKAHDSFMRIGEPGYFQEFGPAGFHVTIGFANPAIINARKPGLCTAATPCNNTVKGHVTTARMSRTPDERLYGSGDRSAFVFTQCYASLGDPDGAEFAFVKCAPDGSFQFDNIPGGNWKLTLFDQWNDQIVDGISTAIGLAGKNATILDMGEIAAHQWQANFFTRTFIDSNGDGVSQPTEPGLALVKTNVRYRDGSISNRNNTDLNGYAAFNEEFPLFNWYVIETDTTRYKNTGTHVVYDAGGPADGTSFCNSTSNPSGAKCGGSTIAKNYANTYETFPLPTNLHVPGAVYCATADCSAESVAASPGGSNSPVTNSTGRIDPPWVITEGWQGFSGQNNFLEFGKKPFVAGENGGIHGHVVYSSTRPFDDPQFGTQNVWEPLVPNVTINLYMETTAPDGSVGLALVDQTQTTSFDDWAQGFRSDGMPNMNCPGQSTTDPFFFGLQNQPNYLNWYNSQHGGPAATAMPYNAQYKCYDGLHNWNQLQPAPYDGMYQFPSMTNVDPVTGKPTGTNCTICTPNPDSSDGYRSGLPMLPSGKYVVEVVVPPGFDLTKEEDKNILIGDNFIAPVTQQFGGLGNVFILPDQASIAASYNANSAQNATNSLGRVQNLTSHEGDTPTVNTFWPCVGDTRIVPDYISLFPQSKQAAPFAGAKRNLCDRKEVALDDQTSDQVEFFVWTQTHKASKFTGVITDDFSAEFDPFSPQFGEKFAPGYLPVSVKDWAGNEVARVLSDQWGGYNGLNYSTWEVNPPNPTGYAPTMMVTCMNDPGDASNPDPHYQPGYSNFCYELAFMPGDTGYFDTPVVPTSAFSDGYNHPDCAYPDATPAVSSVIGGDGVAGPWVKAPGSILTINALGDQMVENYGYSGPDQTAVPFNQKTVKRHYGFGSQCTSPTAGSATCNTASTVMIGGVAATVTSWSDTSITVTAPGSVPACAVQQQAQYGGSPAQCGQLVITAGNGKQSVDTVTVTIGGKKPAPWVAGQTIQSAIDAASPGDLIIVPKGSYKELLLMWKPVRLQGVGAVSSVVDASPHPAGKLDPWRRQVDCVFGLGMNGTPISATNPFDTTGNYSCPAAMQFSVDRLPLEATVGWTALLNGNLAEQLIEPSLMGAYEGAAITVLGKGVKFCDPTDPTCNKVVTDPAVIWASDVFPNGTHLLTASDCTAGANRANPYPSNFFCNPSSIDGMSFTNSSQGGGGIMVHGWGHNLQIANNVVRNNQGTLSGGITIGQGEHPDVALAGQTPTTVPGSCESDTLGTLRAGQTPNQALAFCFDMNVNIHHNKVTLNSSLGDELFSSTPAGAGGVTVCNGSDYYKFKYNWVCGNMSTGDGAGFAHIGWSKNGDVEHNTILFNQSTNPTITTNGGGLLVMGAPDQDPPCGATNDKDCLSAPNTITPSDGSGYGLVINANLIMGNSADSGSGGGLRLQHINGNDVLNFPNGATACANAGSASCLWNSVTVTNNIITDNVAGWDGGGVSLQDALAVNIVNNTIVSNDSTASAGPLFGSLFAPLASTPGVNCTTATLDQSCPQVAGIVSITNSDVLTANIGLLAPTVVTCPPGHGTNGSCAKYSVPALANNIVWENRSFVVGVGTFGPAGSGTSQQHNVTLFNSAFNGVSASVPAASQPQTDATTPNGNGVIITGGTGACTGASYWDIGVRGDLGPANHASGGTLAPQYSVLTDAADYPGANNSGSDPTLLSQYCNGSKVPPEAGNMGYTVNPGTNEVNALPTPVFSLTPSATVDEGNNWINLRWGPVSLVNPVTGTTLGNYSVAVGSPAIDAIPISVGTANQAPSTDFFGNPRPAGAGFDIGAVEFPELTLSPATGNFGSQAVLTPSAAQTFTLSNPMTRPAVTGIAVSLTGANASDFAITANSCGAGLAPGAQCTISVTFTPNLLGAKTGTLSVTDSQGTQTASLTGTGTGPLYSVTPAALSFINTVVNTTSATQTLTVRNNQTVAMNFTARALSGLFKDHYQIVAAGTTCVVGTPVLSGATCLINLRFTPTAVYLGNTPLGGIRPASLTLTAAGLTTNAALSGTALLFPVDVTPKGFFGLNGQRVFPNTQVGQASAPLIATLSNYQSTAVTVNSISVPTQFQMVPGASTTCTAGAILPAAAADGTPSTCTVAFEFAPNAQNLLFGFLNWPWMKTGTFNLSGSPVNPTIMLMGMAFKSAITGTAAFGSQQVGTTSTAHTFTYANSGGTPVTVTAALTGANAGYAITSNNCSTVAAGGTCQVGVTFTPSAAGFRTAALTLTDAIGTQAVNLTGTGK